MNRFSLLAALLLLPGILKAQNDPQALKILDKFSSLAQAAPSVSLKFKMITIDQSQQKNDTVKGFLLMSKDRYRLEMPDYITWFNGSVSWNYLLKEKEVTITKPGKKDDSFIAKPSSIFTLYKKGFKTRLVEENGTSYIVDLYPEDINSELVRIRMAVGKVKSDLIGAEYKRKDGISVYLVVNDYNLKAVPVPADFVFDQKKYKDAEVIDMR